MRAEPSSKQTSVVRVFLNLLLGALTVTYPFLIYFGLAHWDVRLLASVILAVLLLRLAFLKQSGAALRNLAPLLSAAALLCLLALWRNEGSWFLYYPIAVSLTMLAAFGHTLRHGMPMIERFARIKEPDLPEFAVAYCRKVTLIWCGFFVVNGLIATGTVIWGDMKVWTLYNGLISYLLMGLLFIGEFAVRRRLKARYEAKN